MFGMASGGVIAAAGGGPPVGGDLTIESVTESPSIEENDFITFEMPATRPDGDLYIVHIVRDEQAAYNSTAEFNAWAKIFDEGLVSDAQVTIGWRIGNSEPSIYTWTHTAGGEQNVAHVIRISGAHATTPIDGSGSATGDSATATAPSVTAPRADAIVLRFFAVDNELFATSAAGGDVVELYRSGATGTGRQGVSGYSQPGPAAGVGSGTLNQSLPSERWHAATVIIRKAGT